MISKKGHSFGWYCNFPWTQWYCVRRGTSGTVVTRAWVSIKLQRTRCRLPYLGINTTYHTEGELWPQLSAWEHARKSIMPVEDNKIPWEMKMKMLMAMLWTLIMVVSCTAWSTRLSVERQHGRLKNGKIGDIVMKCKLYRWYCNIWQNTWVIL